MEKPPFGKGPLGGAEASGKKGLPQTDEALLADCRVDTFRAGGKGGQHQNKTESGVRLTHLPTGIVVTARESPSQARNRRVAVSRLRERLNVRAQIQKPRVPTRTPLKEKRKRVDDKKRKSKLKRLRKAPERDD